MHMSIHKRQRRRGDLYLANLNIEEMLGTFTDAIELTSYERFGSVVEQKINQRLTELFPPSIIDFSNPERQSFIEVLGTEPSSEFILDNLRHRLDAELYQKILRRLAHEYCATSMQDLKMEELLQAYGYTGPFLESEMFEQRIQDWLIQENKLKRQALDFCKDDILNKLFSYPKFEEHIRQTVNTVYSVLQDYPALEPSYLSKQIVQQNVASFIFEDILDLPEEFVTMIGDSYYTEIRSTNRLSCNINYVTLLEHLRYTPSEPLQEYVNLIKTNNHSRIEEYRLLI